MRLTRILGPDGPCAALVADRGHVPMDRVVEAAGVPTGFTTVIDTTGEDVLQRKPRFLTRARSCDGFLVLGPALVTIDEPGDVITSGTPGAEVLADGDTVGCEIPGEGEISCRLRDPKVAA